MTSPYYLLLLLIASIVFIIWLTAYRKVNAFFALLLATLAVGIFSGFPLENIVSIMKAGVGHTMEKIGLLIILGTTLGVILEKTGATTSMATAILKIVKEKNAPLAIAITGFIVGFPIFCDSGFIVLSGLNRSLVRKSHHSMPVMAAVLGTSLYSVHCLVPPHPGITAAVGTTNANVGIVMLWGLVLAIPAALVGYVWSVYQGKRASYMYIEKEDVKEVSAGLPPAALSFLPVLLPIILIASGSIIQLYQTKVKVPVKALHLLSFSGDPVIALLIGVAVSLPLVLNENKGKLPAWLAEGVEKAGMILAIIAGGGMFGEMLQATGLGKNLSVMLHGSSLGIFFPFIVALAIKTAQGSSTVAVITASSLVSPMLTQLGMHDPVSVALTVLSMGAGSMVISHANDAYFWVISRFSNLDVATTLKVYSFATLLMGLTVQLLIWIVFKIIHEL